MFSNDENIETIGQLVVAIKHYIGLQSQYVKLDVVERVVRLLTAFVMMTVLAVLLFLALIYASFALAFALETLVGKATAFLLVAADYIVVLLLCVVYRKRWIERPLVRFLSNVLIHD